tara:strand:+ start:12047 stop:12163 length:117 start_codon:yes stop_codon:yes gene_type:complete
LLVGGVAVHGVHAAVVFSVGDVPPWVVGQRWPLVERQI